MGKMELVKSENKGYAKYEELLLTRDLVRKEAGSYLTAYIKEFGSEIKEEFEARIECIRKKKAIALLQQALNHGDTIDAEQLKKYLDEQMVGYYEQLIQMEKDNEAARKARVATEVTLMKCKKIYRKIAKTLHPDINPMTSQIDVLRELWERTLTAYNHNDLKELQELEVIIGSALKELGADDVCVDIVDIEEKISQVEAEIEKIVSEDPYRYKDLLENPRLVEDKHRELQEKIASYTKYSDELEEVMTQLMIQNGASITWKMN